MRRQDIIDGLTEVQHAISASGVNKIIDIFFSSRGKIDEDAPRNALAAYAEYKVFASSFSEPAQMIISIFDLESLEASDFWMAIIMAKDSALSQVTHITFRQVRFLFNLVPSIVKLLDQEGVQALPNGTKTAMADGMAILSVIIVEEGKLSGIDRISTLLQGVELLYQSCAEINHTPVDQLRLIACDSGSDKTFDFLGHAKIIECVKDVFFQLWDRILFFKERRTTEQFKVIAEALPIMAHIAELQEKQQIAPEIAERLRHNVSSGLDKVFSSKVYIPEVKGRINSDPRQIVAPEQKLLTSSGEHIGNNASEAVEGIFTEASLEIDDMTPEQAKALLKKLTNAKSND